MTSGRRQVFRLTCTCPLWGESAGARWIPLTHAWPIRRHFAMPFSVSMNKLKKKQRICEWFETQWHSCDVTVMVLQPISFILGCAVSIFDCVCIYIQHASYTNTNPLVAVQRGYNDVMPSNSLDRDQYRRDKNDKIYEDFGARCKYLRHR